MFMDQYSMPVLRQHLLAGRFSDLTLIRGRNLVLLKPEIGAGHGTAKFYSNVFARKGPRGPHRLQEIHRHLSARIAAEVGELLHARDFEGQINKEFLKEKFLSISEALRMDLLN
jgi:hypothetical protein